MKNVRFLLFVPFVVAIIVLFLFSKESDTEKKEVVLQGGKEKKIFKLKEEDHVPKVSSVKKKKFKQPKKLSNIEVNPAFSYEEEVGKVKKYAQGLPQTKKQLVNILIKPDPFRGKNVKPHSMDEIQQNKMGAVKVLALKALMSLKDPEVLSRNLDEVILKAEDPTIVKIAKAAKESRAQGRSFFDDYPEAFQNL